MIPNDVGSRGRHERCQSGYEIDRLEDDVDMDNPEQAAIWKTVQVLLNKIIYADSYLQQ